MNEQEFKELEAYLRYYVEELYKNTKFYLIDIHQPHWKAAWNNPEEIIKQLKWKDCNYKHLSFEEFKQWDRRHLYE